MASPRFRVLAIGLGAAFLSGCDTPPPCPLIVPQPPLLIIIEKGVYDGECLYEVAAEQPDGTSVWLSCAPELDGECSCSGGSQVGEHHLSVVVDGAFVLAEYDVTIRDGHCSLEAESVVYEAVPPSQLPRPACQAADEHLTSCGYATDEMRCIELGLRALVPDTGAMTATVQDCIDSCVASPSCDELEHDFCAPASEITDFELCAAECIDASEADIADLGPQLGPSSYCGLGGAGGSD